MSLNEKKIYIFFLLKYNTYKNILLNKISLCLSIKKALFIYWDSLLLKYLSLFFKNEYIKNYTYTHFVPLIRMSSRHNIHTIENLIFSSMNNKNKSVILQRLLYHWLQIFMLLFFKIYIQEYMLLYPIRRLKHVLNLNIINIYQYYLILSSDMLINIFCINRIYFILNLVLKYFFIISKNGLLESEHIEYILHTNFHNNHYIDEVNWPKNSLKYLQNKIKRNYLNNLNKNFLKYRSIRQSSLIRKMNLNIYSINQIQLMSLNNISIQPLRNNLYNKIYKWVDYKHKHKNSNWMKDQYWHIGFQNNIFSVN